MALAGQGIQKWHFPAQIQEDGTVKGDPKIIAVFNEVLKAELTAINQYFLHAEMCANWGYYRLAGVIRKESIEEMTHAEKCMERILYLEGTPNMSDYFKINIGGNVLDQLNNDLQLEYDAVKRLNKGITLCGDLKDDGSRELLKSILLDEEHHIDWLEAQLHAIKEIGIQNYLTQWMGEASDEKK
ncbi:MAG TPA: bacterioferritin [Terriglobales bacterium]|nr:bacterioferritin [Terriglobales bacterium]